jgi:hypothetical protein
VAVGTLATAATLPLAVPAAAGALLAPADGELLQLGARLLHIKRALAAVEADPTTTDKDFDPWNEQLEQLTPQIFARTAVSREGIAVQVAAAIEGCRDLWEGAIPEDEGIWEVERPFIEAIARFAGVPAPEVKPHIYPIVSNAPTPFTDPIFPAIRRHRAALVEQFRRIKPAMDTPHADPKHDALDSAAQRAYSIADSVAKDLTKIEPTTILGAIALLDYVDGVHTGAVELPDDPKNYCSDSESLPKISADNLVSKFNGKPLELDFNFWVMRNVRAGITRYFHPDDAELTPFKPHDDPIYAAIETHKQGWQALGDFLPEQEKYELSAAGRNHDGLPAELEKRLDGINNAINGALDDLETTVPTTLAGAAALLQYLADFRDAGGEPMDADWYGAVHRNVALAITAAANPAA